MGRFPHVRPMGRHPVRIEVGLMELLSDVTPALLTLALFLLALKLT
jgi:hypothetical protein